MSALKKLNKGSTVMLIDQNGGQAKDVAKALTKLGIGKVLVMQPGQGGCEVAGGDIRGVKRGG